MTPPSHHLALPRGAQRGDPSRVGVRRIRGQSGAAGGGRRGARRRRARGGAPAHRLGEAVYVETC